MSVQSSPPKAPSESSDGVPAREETVPLRLTVTRGHLGIELYTPLELGPLEVTCLAFSLPGLRFPIDLSGGVPRFRNRRGVFEHLELRTSAASLGAWLEPRLSEIVGRLEQPVSVWVKDQCLSVGLVGTGGALSFDLLWIPTERDARFVVARARGAKLSGPAHGFALRAMDAVLGKWASRRGRVIEVRDPALKVCRALLPGLGTRVPATDAVVMGSIEAELQEYALTLDSTGLPFSLPVEAVRELELAHAAEAGDDALARGDLDAARRAYVEALNFAPRHPGLSGLLAEIDSTHGGRDQVALGWLSDAGLEAHTQAVFAELLARDAQFEPAQQAMTQAAQAESFGPLVSLWWLSLAERDPDWQRKRAALDRAVSAAPSLFEPRWQRFQLRLELFEVQKALADAQHMEAATHGARRRHELCVRVARCFSESGHTRSALHWFERALRYAPDDPVASLGLARSFSKLGKSERALTLMHRAVTLSEQNGNVDAEALIDLARLLAEQAGDLPAAIVRLGEVPPDSTRKLEALALQADLRSKIGDLAGASLAYARLRDGVARASGKLPREVRTWLFQAARFEEQQCQDVVAAEHHLAVLLRALPQDDGVAEAYRRVAALAAQVLERAP